VKSINDGAPHYVVFPTFLSLLPSQVQNFPYALCSHTPSTVALPIFYGMGMERELPKPVRVNQNFLCARFSMLTKFDHARASTSSSSSEEDTVTISNQAASNWCASHHNQIICHVILVTRYL
jgi:hypothetical protein